MSNCAPGWSSLTRGERGEHRRPVLARPVHADEQVARAAPVARRRLGELVALAVAHNEHALGGHAVAAHEALGDPVSGAAAGERRRIGPALTIGIALEVRLGERPQVRPWIALASLQQREPSERHHPVTGWQQHLAAALNRDAVETCRPTRGPCASGGCALRSSGARAGQRCGRAWRLVAGRQGSRPHARGDAAHVGNSGETRGSCPLIGTTSATTSAIASNTALVTPESACGSRGSECAARPTRNGRGEAIV